MNNEYEITVSSPLLRPGLEITTWVSEKYLVAAIQKLMDAVRAYNATCVVASETKSAGPKN